VSSHPSQHVPFPLDTGPARRSPADQRLRQRYEDHLRDADRWHGGERTRAGQTGSRRSLPRRRRRKTRSRRSEKRSRRSQIQGQEAL